MKSTIVENHIAGLIIISFGLILSLSTIALGQQVSWSPTDNGKSAAFVLPSAWGTDEVNLYNGRVALNVPLGTIGGRGGAAYQPSVSISRTFVMRGTQDTIPMSVFWWTQPPKYMVISESYMDSFDHSNFQPGLLPAVMIVRRTRDQHPGTFSSGTNCQTLTKVYLRLPGKEIELRDVATNGEPDHDDGLSPFNRGRAWHSVDGSNTYFLSDADIVDVSCGDRDWPAMNNANVSKPNGYLLLNNGTRYRFVEGKPVWMRDRNGNTLAFGPPTSIPVPTDSMGRQYGISIGGFSYKGVDGTTQTVGIESGLLETALRADIVASGGRIRREEELFPTSALLRGPTNTFNPSVTKAISLPNGLKYRFFYNEYGELARIEMPAGGIIEYDYPALGMGQTGCSGTGACYVHRPVKEKRLFDASNEMISRVTFEYGSGTTVKVFDPDGTVVRNERHTFNGSVDADFQSTQWYRPFDNGRERTVEVLDSTGQAVLRRTDNTWKTLDVNGAPTTPPQGSWTHPTNLDCALTEVKTTLEQNQVSLETFVYDGRGNPTDIYEYEVGSPGTGVPGALVRRTHTDYVTDSAYTHTLGSYILNLPSKKWVSSDLSGVAKVSMVHYEYDNYTDSPTDSRHAPLVDRSNIFGHCLKLDDTATNCLEGAGAGHVKRGNLTQTTAFFDIPGNHSIQNSIEYDIAGNAVRGIDGRGNATTISYDDAFGLSDGTVRSNTAPSELNGRSAFAFATSTTNAAGHTSFVQYNYNLGVPVDSEDPNGTITIFEYGRGGVGATNVDPLDRLSKVISAFNSTSDKIQTSYSYDDLERIITTKSDLNEYGDNRLKKELLYDGFGRTIETHIYESSSSFITKKFEFDALSRTKRIYNAHRTTSDQNFGWTDMTYDSLSRLTKAKTFDRSGQPTGTVETEYRGTMALVTDQAGVKRLTQTAVRGLTDVWEITGADADTVTVTFGAQTLTGYRTQYEYDILGNLTKVKQGTQPNRTFLYDALGRLKEATNPESGLTVYGYDEVSNITSKKDGRNVTSTYEYDAINRLKTQVYSDGTPAVTYAYDTGCTGCNTKGKLISVSSSVSTYSYSTYDRMGRIKNGSQTLGGQTYSSSYDYHLSGHIKKVTYPSGRTVNYVYDDAGRATDVTGNLGVGGAARNYATGIVYDAESRLIKERFGTDTPIFNKLFHNSRGQLAEIRVSTSYTGPTDTSADRGAIINHYSNQPGCNGAGCNASDNNGNLMRQEIRIPNSDTFSQFYEYDFLNRLKLVRESKNGGSTLWKQTYNYDPFGNRTIDQDATDTFGTGIPKSNFRVNPDNNRLEVPVGQSGAMVYDSAGNLITDTYIGTVSIRTYDAENRMTSETRTNNVKVGEYAYDGIGRRVVRNVSGVVTWQIYGLGGELLAEYAQNGSPAGPQKEYGYRNGALLVVAAGTNWGSMPVIHDNPLIVSETTIQSRHITELRTAIDALRTNMGLAAYSWQQPVAIGVLIKADPIIEMRTALNEALGIPSGGYSAGLTQGFDIKAVHIQELRDRVTAAWSSGSVVQLNWLVTDQLGTPRMILKQSGAIASRHDYLPFGEELLTGRDTTPGYNSADTVRQKFTAKERDVETGLDYSVARYYLSTQGRFTSADQPFADQSTNDPQSWNLYSYVRNNPLIIIDPTGRFGDYYNRDGRWAYTDGINDNKVYVLNETREADGSVNLTPQLLPITHTEFTRSANIVRHEGGTNDTDEYLWIAHASNNEATATNTTLHNLLQTGFSSAPASVKNTGVATTDSSVRANAARAGVIDAVAGGADPTGGARRWDGTDFLAWGLNGPWGSHAKFREFASIHISGQIFSTYENAQTTRWGNSVTYSRRRYTIPAAVFTNAANWTQNRDFHYVTGARNQTRNLVATGARGQTIFWRF